MSKPSRGRRDPATVRPIPFVVAVLLATTTWGCFSDPPIVPCWPLIVHDLSGPTSVEQGDEAEFEWLIVRLLEEATEFPEEQTFTETITLTSQSVAGFECEEIVREGDIPFPTGDVPVPDFGPGVERSLALESFDCQVGDTPVEVTALSPDDYTLTVRVGSAAPCSHTEDDAEAEHDFAVRCACGDLESIDLRVDNLETSPASPFPLQQFTLHWQAHYEVTPCPSAPQPPDAATATLIETVTWTGAGGEESQHVGDPFELQTGQSVDRTLAAVELFGPDMAPSPGVHEFSVALTVADPGSQCGVGVAANDSESVSVEICPAQGCAE